MGWLFGDSPDLATDGSLHTELRKIVTEAKKQIVIVSPYIDPGDDFVRLLEKAAREMDVSVVFRADKLDEYSIADWFRRLRAAGVTLLIVEKLHSKIYLNEGAALVSSMNFTKASWDSSREIGITFPPDDPDLGEKLAKYIEELLAEAKPADEGRGVARVAKGKFGWRRDRPARGGQGEGATTAHCIGCAREVPANRERPFCYECFGLWDKSKTSPQKHCFRCGKKARTTFDRPLCNECYSGG